MFCIYTLSNLFQIRFKNRSCDCLGGFVCQHDQISCFKKASV